MAVAPASMADKIIVLDDDDDEEESPRPSCSAYASPAHQQAKRSFPLRAPPPAPTHITQSPFASAKKHTHVLQAENQRLFTEFVDHCSSITQDCPEVLDFLRTKHAKSSPEYLSSVEFRNTLGRCLTHTQAKRSKAYVYINELCTALRQHAVKRRQTLAKVEPGTSTSASGFADSPKGEGAGDDATNANEAGERPSGLQEGDNHQAPEAEKKAKRASKRQIAYLENLLKVYNDEISRLQQTDLNLDDLGAEDSIYIQEHRLKRKMMKIYETLCELKNCSTLTGRVIEQRLSYSGTRYPEINRKIERYINSPEAHQNPPDYQDIHHQVLRANERHNLCLSARQLTQIAQEVFTETGSSLQERRHQDLVYNFGSRLTDNYKSATDPALADPSLLRRLRQNREVALSRLKEVVTTYAVRQEDMEEEDRARRLDRDNRDKETHKAENGEGHKVVNGVAPVEEEEEGEDDEDDESSDPDIEEEIEASTQQDGPGTCSSTQHVQPSSLKRRGSVKRRGSEKRQRFHCIHFPVSCRRRGGRRRQRGGAGA
ncbi:Death domain-associated protein 6 [Liparis tanakae]|uniref:Death domain-associated protein 6 n=1 Tax=Liparis tanakae TaxID=230148 RepID=A0A4Z2EZR4_9TELE|nr:Death domain-associated protein 6 [Liparis tanakae]